LRPHEGYIKAWGEARLNPWRPKRREKRPVTRSPSIADELRKPGRSYVPVVFDFEKSQSQTTTETVTLLARMARFVIADLTDAKSVLQELQAIVPSSPKLPVRPLIITAQDEPGLFDSIEITHGFARYIGTMTSLSCASTSTRG
jgi:hypothetical protein